MSTYRSNTQVRTNRFAAPCTACRQTVGVDEGSLNNVSGRWVVRHLGECPTPPPVVASPLATLTPGYRYAVETGEGETGQPVRFFKVSKVRRNGSVYVDQQLGGNFVDAAVVRADGSVDFRDERVRPYLLAAAADPQAAAERYGRLKGLCYVGGEPLTDWVSRALWVGPVCDHRSRAERKALALAAGATPDDEG